MRFLTWGYAECHPLCANIGNETNSRGAVTGTSRNNVLAQISLGGLDYTAIGVYGIVIILIAAWCSRQQQSASDFLLAGRSMGWIVIGISQLASLLSAISYLGNPGEAYAHDLKLLIYTVCGFLVVPIVIYLFLDFFYRLNSASIYEYLERRFNYPTRVLASAIFIAARLAWMATIFLWLLCTPTLAPLLRVGRSG